MSIENPESQHGLGMNSNYYIYSGDGAVPMEVSELSVHHSVVAIPRYAFCKRSNLKKVVLCEGLRIIGGHAFEDCVRLESIKIPFNVIEINHSAFSGCNVLKKVELSEGLLTVGPLAFNSCRSLERIKVPSSVINIDRHAFGHCRGLKEVLLCEGLQSIGDDAFWYCESLEKVTIPSSLESIGNDAFRDCFDGSRDRAQCMFGIFSSALCNTSSINSTYSSNHNLTSIGENLERMRLELTGYERRILSDLLELNGIADKHQVAALKIIRYHDHLDVTPMLEWDLKCLPLVVDWFDRAVMFSAHEENFETKKLDSVYQLVRGSPPE